MFGAFALPERSVMRFRRLVLALLLAPMLLAGCGKTDPQAALEAAVQELQDNLEAKKTGAVVVVVTFVVFPVAGCIVTALGGG